MNPRAIDYHFASTSNSEIPVEIDELICLGTKCVIKKDDKNAKLFQSGLHLRLWKEDTNTDLWIDRFDARNDLDRIDVDHCYSVMPKEVVGPRDYMLDEEEADYFVDLLLERYQDILDFKEETLLNQDNHTIQK